MNEKQRIINDLVIANRILAREEVVDAYGHVSIRNPSNPHTFFIARSLAPELVTAEDIVELDLDGNPVNGDTRPLYLERFIHGSIFEKRPDVMAVVHAHAEEIGAQTRDRLNAQIMEKRKAFDEEIAANLTSEEHTIADSKARAMENVREMAIEAAHDIVARFTGKAPPKAAIVAAVEKINHY